LIRKIGKLIIVIALLLSWNFYLLIFLVPAFLLGVILLWKRGGNRQVNTLWTVLPILIWYPLGLIILSLMSIIGMATTQKLDFIIPSDFRGDIIIVGNMPCGQSKIVKNGREQLLIPSNGILLYKEKLEYGYVNQHYYFSSKGSMLKEIPERHNYMYFESEKNPPSRDVVGAWLGGMGNKTIEENTYYEFMTLTIGSKDSIDKYSNFQEEKQFEHLTDSLVTSCLR
jgi:hypothetical protein